MTDTQNYRYVILPLSMVMQNDDSLLSKMSMSLKEAMKERLQSHTALVFISAECMGVWLVISMPMCAASPQHSIICSHSVRPLTC